MASEERGLSEKGLGATVMKVYVCSHGFPTANNKQVFLYSYYSPRHT